MSDVIDKLADFPAKHAMRHKLGPDERESLAHMLLFPEQGIAGFIYPSVRTSGAAKSRAHLFGPGLAEPVAEEIEMQVGPEMDFDAWTTGPLTMAVREPHKVVDLQWHGERIRFDGRYTALHPPFAFSMHPDGNPPYYGDDRTEQHGRLSCDVAIDGKTFHHEGFLIRDHSWGPRVWGLNQHYKWFHAVTPSCSVHFFEMQSFGATQLRGFLWKDGVMRLLADIKYKIKFDEAMFQQEFDVTVTDIDGRSVDIACRTFTTIQLDKYDPMIYLNEAAITVEMAGETGVGWLEFCWNRNYFDFAKDYVTRFA